MAIAGSNLLVHVRRLTFYGSKLHILPAKQADRDLKLELLERIVSRIDHLEIIALRNTAIPLSLHNRLRRRDTLRHVDYHDCYHETQFEDPLPPLSSSIRSVIVECSSHAAEVDTSFMQVIPWGSIESLYVFQPHHEGLLYQLEERAIEIPNLTRLNWELHGRPLQQRRILNVIADSLKNITHLTWMPLLEFGPAALSNLQVLRCSTRNAISLVKNRPIKSLTLVHHDHSEDDIPIASLFEALMTTTSNLETFEGLKVSLDTFDLLLVTIPPIVQHCRRLGIIATDGTLEVRMTQYSVLSSPD